jgi:hypothetical protein
MPQKAPAAWLDPQPRNRSLRFSLRKQVKGQNTLTPADFVPTFFFLALGHSHFDAIHVRACPTVDDRAQTEQ